MDSRLDAAGRCCHSRRRSASTPHSHPPYSSDGRASNSSRGCKWWRCQKTHTWDAPAATTCRHCHNQTPSSGCRHTNPAGGRNGYAILPAPGHISRWCRCAKRRDAPPAKACTRCRNPRHFAAYPHTNRFPPVPCHANGMCHSHKWLRYPSACWQDAYTTPAGICCHNPWRPSGCPYRPPPWTTYGHAKHTAGPHNPPACPLSGIQDSPAVSVYRRCHSHKRSSGCRCRHPPWTTDGRAIHDSCCCIWGQSPQTGRRA